MLDMIRGIYSVRSFSVRDNGRVSDIRHQAAGIAQGCPLSPYLFIIVMSVLTADVRKDLLERSPVVPEKPYIVTDALLYADEPMLISSNPRQLQLHFDLVAEKGRKYGLELNMAKTMLLRVQSNAVIKGTDGQAVKCCDRIVYLGGRSSHFRWTTNCRSDEEDRRGEGRV